MSDQPEATIPQALAIAFHHWTGRAAIAIGMLIRPLLDAEFAHAAMLWAIRWGWWRPGD